MKTLVVKKLFAVLFFVVCAHGRALFYVEKSGHSLVKPGEISVVFYMTVANGGKQSIKVNSKYIKCCWIHPGSSSQYDCESMDLHGGIPVTLEPTKTGNITFIFTNRYPMDRVGQCVFHLWHEDIKIAHTIRFNTTLEKNISWLSSLYKRITGELEEDKVCDTMDLDPTRNCKPVSCVQKYNGKRNYFRKSTKQCEPVHECFTKTDEDNLPTTAFDKDHNRCKSLIQNELSKDEERSMQKDMEDSQKKRFTDINPNDPIPIRCNHGKRVGAICVCENGWKTDTSKAPLGDPKFVYDWCNVKARKNPLLSYKKQKGIMIAGLSLTSFALLVAWLWMLYSYLYQTDIHQAKTLVQPKSTLKSKRKLVATDELIKELTDKNILKRKMEAAAKRLYSTAAGTPEKPSVAECETTLTAVSLEGIVQKGKSAVTHSKQSINRSAHQLANEESNISFVERSEIQDTNETPQLRGLSTHSQAGETSNVSIPGKSMMQDKGDAVASKGRSTYSIAGEAATPEQDNRGKMSSVSQISKGHSTFSPVIEASGVSAIDTRGTVSGSTISQDGAVYSATTSHSSNISFDGRESSKQGTPSTPSRLSQITKDHSPYTLANEASSASVTSNAMKPEKSTMSSISQSSNARSPYSLADEGSNRSFAAGKSMKSVRSIGSSQSQSPERPVALYSLSGYKSKEVPRADTSIEEKKKSTMSWSQSMKSGVSFGKSTVKDNSFSSSTRAPGMQSQKSMVVALHSSSSDSD